MAKDIIHTIVKKALINDGWTITHDPFTIEYKEEFLYADLAAERTIAAERAGEKIVVEIKSFVGQSNMQDFHKAVGQYTVYKVVLNKTTPEYKLYLAIGDDTYSNAFQRHTIQLIIEEQNLSLIVVNLDEENVVKWIN